MEASCESAKRDELRPRVLGNVVKIIIKAVTTPYYLFVRLTRVPTTPRTTVQGSCCVSAEITTDNLIALIDTIDPCLLVLNCVERMFQVDCCVKKTSRKYS